MCHTGNFCVRTEKKTLFILVIEDSEIACIGLCCLLENAGYKVDVAETGASALKQFREKQYDFVWSDIGLPDIDGIAVTDFIRSWEKAHDRPATPIVALSAHLDANIEKACLAAGMQAAIMKPITPETLSSFMQKYCKVITINPVTKKEPFERSHLR